MKKIFKNFDAGSFIRMNIGLIIVALGLHIFLIPADLAAGGVAGISMIINEIIPILPIGVIMFLLNIILFILAFFMLGSEFGGYTVYNSLILSLLIGFLEKFYPITSPVVDNLSLVLIYGILIQGIGMAMVFNEGASTGGTDIIAAIVNKFLHIDIGKALFLADLLTALAAVFVFNLELGLYAFLGIMLNSMVIDSVIAGFNTKIEMVIISEKREEIEEFITTDIYRGFTLLHGEGGYTGKPMKIITTLVSRREYIKIKKMAMEIDPNVFIWVNVISEVHGNYR